MDLATELGEQGFPWVFVIHGHGAPNHNRALDQACDYFCETFKGKMINLTGLMPVVAAWDGSKTDLERAEDGLPIHAGTDETSMMLNLRPDLVRPDYSSAKPFTASDMGGAIRIARSSDWPGYFGSPRLAEASRAANGWSRAAQTAIDLALSILDGLDTKLIPRFADEMSKSREDLLLDRASLRLEAEVKRKQQRWLKSQRLH